MVVYMLTDQSSLSRLKGTSVFASQTKILEPSIQKLERDQANSDKFGLVFDNRRIVYAKTIIGNYLSHFDPNWLFLKGDNERHHAPNMGLLYLFEIPFLLYGIYILLFSNFEKNTKLLIFFWFLLAPLPASVTVDVPHAVRTLNFIPSIQIIVAIGILSAFLSIHKHKLWKYLFYLFFAGIFSFNFAYYLDQYFVQLNYYDSSYWQYGYQELVGDVKKIENNYKEIVVSNDKDFDKSYIFFLFYWKYPPEQFQKIVMNRSKDVVDILVGKYKFTHIDWGKLQKGVLYVGSPNEIPKELIPLKTTYYLNGKPAMELIKI